MGHTINYAGIIGQEKRDRAIEDMRGYLSPYSMNIVETVACIATTYAELAFISSFAGVQGYPVVALWEETRAIMHDMTN